MSDKKEKKMKKQRPKSQIIDIEEEFRKRENEMRKSSSHDFNSPTAPRTKSHGQQQKPKRKFKRKRFVLSLDGGGVRGKTTVTFLKHVEEYIQEKINRNFKICHFFDLFCGTSSGAITAGCLASKRFSCNKINNTIFTQKEFQKVLDPRFAYKLIPCFIFKHRPKYTGTGKANFFREVFGEKKMKEITKDLVIPTYDVQQRKTVLIKSNKESHSDVLLREAIDASTSVPVFFEVVEVHNFTRKNLDKKFSRFLIDGGMTLKNPAFEAYLHAKKKWPDDEIYVLSVGTGNGKTNLVGENVRNYGFRQWFKSGMLFVFQDLHLIDKQMKALLGKKYLRVDHVINDEVSKKFDDMSKKNVERLKAFGEKWWKLYGIEVVKFIATHLKQTE